MECCSKIDVCDQIKICVTYHKHTYQCSQTKTFDTIFTLQITIQNCSLQDVQICCLNLSLKNRLFGVDGNTGEEFLVEKVQRLSCTCEDVSTKKRKPKFHCPIFELLSLKNSCQRKVNNCFSYDGNISSHGSQNNDSLISESFFVSPGECCITLTFVVHSIDACDVYLEPSSLCVKGCIQRNTETIPWFYSLLTPGDCALRLERESLKPKFLCHCLRK